MIKYYVFFDQANNRFECVPKRYRRLRDARQALREYRDRYPKAGACFTLARISNWHICDEWGNVDYDVEKVYPFSEVMERCLYESLLRLSRGGSVQFEEIRGFELWSALVDWLKANNIRYNCTTIGRGMRVEYTFKIDGRCAGRLYRILEKVEVL